MKSHAGALSEVRTTLTRDLPLVALILAYITAAYVLNSMYGVPRHVGISLSSWRLLTMWTLVYGVTGFIALLGHGLIRRRRSLREAASWRHAATTFFRPRLLLGFAVVYALLPPFMSAFVAFKMAIPIAHPFAWDAQIMASDRWLHFGLHPWVILEPMLGHPLATRFIDKVYYTWFPFIWLTLLWQLWHGDYFSRSRSQFLLTFAMCWIVLGTIVATVFSSVGPAYFGEIVAGADPYAPLIASLHAIDARTPLTALWAQDVLWQSYVNPGAGQVEGISAMPSMHVAMATLMTLIAFRVNRRLGWLYAVYAGLIFLGSVHLGWHYALDGYVGAIGTISIWYLSGSITTNWERRQANPGPGV